MTDKQIIIDGVDVSGCINYEEYFEEDEDVKIENFCAYWHNSCHSCHNYNCNYKMYKRKEQECERLKKIIDEAQNSKLDLKSFLVGEAIQKEYEQQLDQLKEENEVLEKVNKNNQEKIKKLNAQLEDEFIAKQYGDEALFFTLIDVKQLAKQYTEVGVSGQSMAEQYKLKGKEELAKQILQICEVIDV